MVGFKIFLNPNHLLVVSWIIAVVHNLYMDLGSLFPDPVFFATLASSQWPITKGEMEKWGILCPAKLFFFLRIWDQRGFYQPSAYYYLSRPPSWSHAVHPPVNRNIQIDSQWQIKWQKVAYEVHAVAQFFSPSKLATGVTSFSHVFHGWADRSYLEKPLILAFYFSLVG